MKVLTDRDVKSLTGQLRDSLTIIELVKNKTDLRDWDLYSYCVSLENDIKRMLKKLGGK